MANFKTIIIGTEKIIQPSSSWWGSNDGVFIVSAYENNYQITNSQIAGEAQYYVESCNIINPQTGCIKRSDFFENSTDFVQDTLYNDIYRFGFTESSVVEFNNTFSGHNLNGSEFAAALTAHISEEKGCSPWVIIHSDEKKLIEFCTNRGWTFTVLNEGKDNAPQHVQELIKNIVSNKNSIETRLISSNKHS